MSEARTRRRAWARRSPTYVALARAPAARHHRHRRPRVALILKFLPDAKIEWSDVWVGAVATALLFVIGGFAIGLYLGHASIGSAYGAAGSFVVLLVWMYYSAQILLFGAELTQVRATRGR